MKKTQTVILLCPPDIPRFQEDRIVNVSSQIQWIWAHSSGLYPLCFPKAWIGDVLLADPSICQLGSAWNLVMGMSASCSLDNLCWPALSLLYPHCYHRAASCFCAHGQGLGFSLALVTWFAQSLLQFPVFSHQSPVAIAEASQHPSD